MKQSRIEDVLPLGPLQEGLLFHAQYDTQGLDLYTVQSVFHLGADFDAGAMQLAARALQQRHAVLRAGFRVQGERPVQVIRREVPLRWQEEDLGALPADERDAALERVLHEDRARRFDMARPPLMRFTHVKLGEDRHRLVMTRHHILTDGWSSPILIGELFALYAARGDASQLPPVTPYREYLLWLSKQDRPAAEQAWRTVLEGVGAPTLLVPDAPAQVKAEPENVVGSLSEELTSSLSRLARSRDWTMNTLVQAAWGLLLGALTGRSDVTFGTTVSGRPPEIAGVETMVGLFINTLPVRVRLDPEQSLGALVSRLQEQQIAVMDHQFLSLTDIQGAIGLGNLFDTATVFENQFVDTEALESSTTGAQVSGGSGRDATHYPLALAAGPGRELMLRLAYRPDLIDRATAENCLARLVRIFEAVAADPERPAGRLDLLEPAVRRQVLTEWNDTAREVPRGTLAQLFEAQAARTPEAVAVVQGEERLSYAELNARANRLARHLIGQGVGPEQRVALSLPRSPDWITAVLGVWKAGAAYVPVDRQYPADRVAYMLEDAAPALTLSAPVPEADLAAFTAGNVTDAERTAPLDAGHPAYVIYTSGSTGRPKGVVMPHAGAAGMAAAHIDTLGVGPRSRVFQAVSTNFDPSVGDVLMALLSGAALVLPVGQLVGEDLAAALEEQAATHVMLSASVLATLPAARLPLLETVVTGGEVCPPEVIARWSAGRRLVNAYGPTEAAVVSTFSAPLTADGGVPPIGGPAANTRAYVLDPALRPVAPGVPGDLYLAGGQLARGYLHRAALTAERFVADPYGPPGERMYATGDTARWRAEGVLEFIGRSDEQVKIRGFRIEPGEVQAVLAALPGVAQAAVTVQGDRAGDKRLVGYAVPVEGRRLSEAELRRGAARHLPDHMVPGAFVLLDALPLTPNGKLDKKALPAPDLTSLTAGRAPMTPQEDILCGLFAEVLKLPRVGAEGNFFELGGHSLLATRLVSRIRSTLGAELEVRELFEHPTPAALAGRLDTAAAARKALVPQPHPETVPLSFAQRRQWIINRFEEHAASYNIPFVVRLAGDVDRGALRAALTDVTHRHETLRTVFPEADGKPVRTLVDLSADGAELTVVETEEASLPAALTAEVSRGFDLLTDLPFRATLFEPVGSAEVVLCLVLHHVAADGWSMAPLARDLSVAYAARLRGEAPQWPPLPVQYADFALWQQDVLGSEDDPESAISRQLAYWKETLTGLPEELQLPVDRSRPAMSGFRGDTLEIGLDAALHRELKLLARGAQASVFMVVQAAIALLLSRSGAGEDIALGTPVAGRTDEALDDLVGFFVNTLVLRTDVSGDPTFRELVARVRETDLAAYAHQDVPFERLVEVLNPERSLARHPLFQVMLSMQDNAEPEVDLPGLDVAAQAVDTGSSKFDLYFELAEQFSADGSAEGIAGAIRYSTELFDRASVARLGARLRRLLAAVAAAPDAPCSTVDLLDAAERSQVVEEWNDTAVPVTTGSLPELFEAQVRRTPERTAVLAGSTEETYAQLNARANRLARLLIEEGVGPEQYVAVALPRTADLLVAVLAVLKAGAAYLPVDPGYPADRIRFMLADAAPAAVLTTTRGVHPDLTPAVPRILLDDEAVMARVAALADTDPGPTDRHAPLSADCPAYAIYTSGSTGTPKGVVTTHRDVAHLALDSRWRGGSHDRVLLHSPHAFDASTYEMWVPLLNGGQSVLLPPGEFDADVLRAALEGGKVTALWLTAGLFSLMAKEAPESFAHVREVWAGGDVVSPAAVRGLLAAHPGLTVVNGYGPTETTTFATGHRMSRPPEPGRALPIGRPLDNTRVYVLDDALRPAPVGVAGELYIGGAGLARGYLGRPALTGERFVADPFGAAGARMYRTGDRARWNSHGEVEFLGRADDQVKLRGFRIEPGEIEAALVRHAAVHQAVVVVREDTPGDQRLIAYATLRPEGTAGSAELRSHLTGALPEYMVPSAVVVLAQLPLTANGKVDRRALPLPAFGEDSNRRGASTPREETLCKLFAEVLGLPRVWMDDNFFDLGGHSLLATELAARIRVAFGVDLTIRSLFEAPTVARLAERMVQGSDGDPLEVMLPLRSRGDLPPLFCIHSGMGASWDYYGLLRHIEPDRPVYGLQARGLTRRENLPQTLEEMAEDYLEQIKLIQPEGPYHLLGWSFGGVAAHAMATILQARGEEVALLAMLDSYPAENDYEGDLRRGLGTEHQWLLGLLEGAGITGYEGPVDAATVAVLLRESGMALGALDKDQLESMYVAYSNINTIFREYVPGVYQGSVLYFFAAVDRGEMPPDVASWEPYVAQPLDIVRMDCNHGQMTQPGPIGEVGRVLTARLRSLH
ncbi:amino acid adenylation domain-containing protein [Streptomyces sp. cmx-4-9]|uniref:amino acid adenylation domain-containing protein n=1 Tax=Streptomyces sp. cmx-4-9 TaxID=2790941 RepID=UPI00397F41FF